MLEFIKMFGLGILYTLLFPFIVVFFVLNLVYVFFNYLVLEVVNIVGFFFGYTFTIETELEKRLDSVNEREEDADDHKIDDVMAINEESLKGSDEYE